MAGEAAPAVTAPVPAEQGGGDERARGKSADPFDAAREDVKERRRLRLAPAPKDEAEVVQPGAGGEREDVADLDGAASERDEDANANDEQTDDAPPSDEDAPHWAKALRAERDDLAAKVKAADERDAKWQEASRQVKYAHEDAVDEAKFWRAQFDEMRAIMRRIPVMQRDAQGRYFAVNGADGRPLGHDVDAASLKAVLAEREVAKLKRQLERGRGQDADGLQERFRAEAQGKLSAVRAKFPTLDPQKHPAARDFVEDELHRWQRTGGKWDGIEERAARVDRAIRAEQAANANGAQKQRAQPPPKPGRAQPTAQVRDRTQTVEVNGRRMPRGLSDKEIKEEVRRHRLSRQRG